MGFIMYAPVFFMSLVAVTYTDKAGVKVRVSDNGLDYTNKVIQQFLNFEISKIKLPKVQIDVSGGPGHGKLDATNMKVTNFQSPNYSYLILPPNGIRWTSNKGSITIAGTFDAWYKMLITFTLHGSFAVTADDIQMTADINVVKGVDGRPEIKLPKCSANLGNVRVKISGGPISSIVNLFRDSISDSIESAVRYQLCQQAQTVLLKTLNAKIKTLPIKIDLYGPFLFDYSLVEDPVAGQNFIDTAVNGSITFMGEPSTVDLPQMPPTTGNSRMIYITVSDYVPNSLFTSAQNHNILIYEVSRNSTPQYASYLRTTCPGATCIGTYRSQIATKFPNTSILLDVWSSRTPRLQFSKSKSEISFQLEAKMYAEPKSNNTFLLQVQSDLSANFLPYVVDGKVTGNVNLEDLSLKVLKSEVGDISEFEIWIMLEVLKPILEKEINSRLKEGVVIPIIDDVQLIKPQISMLDRAIQIETDVKYRGY